jgi:hypothetical protein
VVEIVEIEELVVLLEEVAVQLGVFVDVGNDLIDWTGG